MTETDFSIYTIQIKGLKRIIENADAKPLWLYVVDHYDKLDSKGMKDKAYKFNVIVLEYLCSHVSFLAYSDEAERKIDNINMLNYSVGMINSECDTVFEETILKELQRLPEYVSEQVIVKLLAYLNELNIGLRFSQRKL